MPLLAIVPPIPFSSDVVCAHVHKLLVAVLSWNILSRIAWNTLAKCVEKHWDRRHTATLDECSLAIVSFSSRSVARWYDNVTVRAEALDSLVEIWAIAKALEAVVGFVGGGEANDCGQEEQ
jgi:hypothetical protein